MRASGWLKNDGAAVLIGYPKLDGLIDGSFCRDEVLRSYGADPAKLSVLYAPSWCSNFSLEQIGDELTDLLSDGPWTLLVKLHPRSYQLKTRSIGESMGHKHNWREFLDDRAKQGRLIHVLDQDTCRYMTAADILITDQGSTLFEYMVLGRPILYYDTDEGNKYIYITGRLERIRRAAHSFQTPQEALELLKLFSGGQLHEGPDKAEAKKECVQEVFYDVGTATDRAVAAIYGLLELPFPGDKGI
jgi:CDP-glycerol glycerophosphotransferase (TagB/SpsB family)